MKMMIFAAGRGARLRPLTDQIPKPLVKVSGKPLIVYHLEKAAAAGIQDVIINVSYKREQIMAFLGDGAQWGVNIQYSIEDEPLETAGGLVHARQYLGSGAFLVCNADIYHEADIGELTALPAESLHLMMVPNPAEQPKGNFALNQFGRLEELHADNQDSAVTYSGIGLYNTDFVDSIDMLEAPDPECRRTPFYIRRWMQEKKVCGHLFKGLWSDVGNLERLQALELQLAEKNVNN